MKKIHTTLTAAAGIILIGITSSHAGLYEIDLSPGPGVALNLGSNLYVQDHAAGLAGPNAGNNSPASGNEINLGMMYDDVSHQLSFDFAYGAAYGFTNLQAPITASHIHGPGPVNYPSPNSNGGVQLNLAPYLIPSSPLSGRFVGAATLSLPQEQMLFNNELYVNIHSTAHPSGEIRGQLVAVPEPSTGILLLVSSLALLKIRGRR